MDIPLLVGVLFRLFLTARMNPFKIQFVNANHFIYVWMIFQKGGLAQLARAFGWQPKGHRFDSDILHRLKIRKPRL